MDLAIVVVAAAVEKGISRIYQKAPPADEVNSPAGDAFYFYDTFSAAYILCQRGRFIPPRRFSPKP